MQIGIGVKEGEPLKEDHLAEVDETQATICAKTIAIDLPWKQA